MADRRFRVDLAPAAGRQLAKLGSEAQRRIVRELHALEVEPRPRGAQQLSGVRGAPYWRLRVGDYRVIYEIHDDRLLVLVIRIGHRGNVYRL
jgi:mRNA interferase RelE/StbE